MTDERQAFTLLQVTESIRKTLQIRYTSAFWVKAEMNKLNHYPHSGHCYPELVEKKEGKIVAQLRANLWKADYERIDQAFLRSLHEPLQDGIHILFLARIQFDPVHGLSLRILDIDSSFTLGALEREKRETIERLRKEQLFVVNKRLKLALLPQRIAIISVETSKGYADFTKVIDQNPWGYVFFHMLFPALLQGDKAASSIIKQLKRIRQVQHHFDVVAIVRGGGGDVGLSCYNDYQLARSIASFPLPVISGIGHSTNETVVEMVAHENAITPTDLGNFLIQKFHNVSVPVQEGEKTLRLLPLQRIQFAARELQTAGQGFQQRVNQHIHNEKGMLREASGDFSHAVKIFLGNDRAQLDQSTHKIRGLAIHNLRLEQRESTHLAFMLKQVVGDRLLQHLRKHDYFENSLKLLDPVNVLKRGYSITYSRGKLVRSVTEGKEGEMLETHFADGILKSKIQNNA